MSYLSVGATSPDNQTAPFRSKNLNLSARIVHVPRSHTPNVCYGESITPVSHFPPTERIYYTIRPFPRPPTPPPPRFPNTSPNSFRIPAHLYRRNKIREARNIVDGIRSIPIFRRSGQIRCSVSVSRLPLHARIREEVARATK